MGGAQYQFDESLPPRRGAVFALTVDSTVRAYDMLALDIGGFTPSNAQRDPKNVIVYMQAETNGVYFYFQAAAAGAVVVPDLSDTSTQAATSAPVAYANTYAALLPPGLAPIKFRLNRAIDRFLIVKAASTSGTLRMWAGSAAY